MSITSVINDTVTSTSLVNAQKPLPPTITNYSVGGVDDTALDPAGGQTVQINGTGFLPGATITFDGSAVAVVTYVSPNRLTFTSPAKSAGTYTIYVVNADGGTAIYIPGIIYSVLPTWTTGAGTLGSYYETQSISNTVVASGDAPITYSLFSGSLPTGASLAANGVITGTAPVDSSSTTYSFTIQATDAQLQDSTRSFSLTINTDAVTWVSPANGTTYTSAVDSAIANVTLNATDAAGYGIVYTANALPTGLSLSGNTISGTPTVIADSSTLLTATANTTSRSATTTINWSINVANDPYFEYNTLLIPGASTTFVDDASTNNFAVTINGDTKPNSFNPYTPGYYSNYFDGTEDYLSLASTSTLAFGTGDFCVEMYYYQTTNVGLGLFSNSASSGGGDAQFEIQLDPTNRYPQLVGWATIFLTSSVAGALNSWNHLVVCRSGTTASIFLNGTRVATATVSNNFSSVNAFNIGRSASGGNTLTGYMSNVRAVKGSSVYDPTLTTLTVPAIPLTAIANTSLLTCQSNRFIDNSTNNFTITVAGNTSINSFDPFTPNSSYSSYGSGYFDGLGDWLTLPNNAGFAFGSGAFTVEMWVYITGSSGTVANYSNGQSANSNFAWELYQVNTTTMQFSVFEGATQYISSSTSFKQNTWNHIACVRNSNTLTTYVNGVAGGTTANITGVTISDPASATLKLCSYANGSSYVTGYISNFRVVKGTAVYTTAFTPPTSPLTAIANTSLLTLQNNQSVNNSVFLDNSTNNFLVTRAGNTTQGTFSPYGGNWSNYFGSANGNSLYLSAQSSGTGGVALSGDYTIEMWLYPTAASGSGYSMLVATNTNGGVIQFYYNSSGALGYYSPVAGQLTTSTSPLTFNAWQHVALVRSSNVVKVYVNGVEKPFPSTITDSSTVYANYIGGLGTVYNTFGYISNLRVLNGTALYTTTFTPPTTPLTPITNTALLTCQSNRLIDNSINNYTINQAGSVSTQRFSPFNPSSVTPTSYSGYLDGSGDWLTAPDNDALDLGSSDFTIEGWFYQTGNLSTSSGGTGLVTKWTDASNQRSWQLSIRNAAGTATFYYSTSGSDYPAITFNSVTLTSSTWTHFALVRTGNTLNLYKNGTLAGTSAFNNTIYNSTSPLAIGAWFGGSAGVPDTAAGNTLFQGYTSNIRVVKGVAVYTSAFTVPTSPLQATQSSGTNIAAITGTSTSLLTCQSPTFIDNSTNNFTITAVGNSQPTIQNPFGYTSTTTNGYTPSTIGGSGYFDGTGDSLSLSNTISFESANFTVEMWIYPTSLASDMKLYGAWAGYQFWIATNGRLIWQFGGSNSPDIAALYISANRWVHIAWVRFGNSMLTFIDGVLKDTTSYSGTVNSSVLPVIGKASDSASDYFYGYMSNLRIVRGTALYTSNFVPPTQPLTAVQNTALLTNMISAGIYDASMMNNIETVGNAQLSTAVTKFGSSSMYFDGTGDYLTAPASTLLTLGSGAFTIETWLYISGSQTQLYGHQVLGTYPATGNGYALVINRSNNGPLGIIWANGSPTSNIVTTNSYLNVGQWYHLAVVRTSTASNGLKIYLDGVNVATGTDATNDTVLQTLYIASQGPSGGYFPGYLDDLRITKGYARYTSNFTPPTTAFPVY